MTSLDLCGGIVEDNYGEESRAWEGGLRPATTADRGPAISAVVRPEFTNPEYQKHLRQHGRRSAARYGGRPRLPNLGPAVNR